MAITEHPTFCRICEALVRHGRDGRGREGDEAAPRPRAPAEPGRRLPEGHRDARSPRRPRPRAAPDAPAPGRQRVRARLLGRGARRHRHPAAHDPLRARRRRHRLVHGQPRGVQLLAPGLGQGLPRRARLPALLHGLLAGRVQPLRRQRDALRLAGGRPDPGPGPHRPPARRRRQPVRLPRIAAHRPADPRGPARRSPPAAAASSSWTRAAPRPPATSSTWRSARTPTPG